MYALYNEAENEYVGVGVTHDQYSPCPPEHVLMPYSQLEKGEPYLYVAKSKKQAESLIDVANDFYGGTVPRGVMLVDFSCYIENISDYKVVKIGTVQE